MLKIKSVNKIIPPAKTGKDNNDIMAVIKIDQTNNGNLYMIIPGTLVVKNYIAPNTRISLLNIN